jgi:uncharacterized membrane protein YdjX (TVP38/TMEM64 family)
MPARSNPLPSRPRRAAGGLPAGRNDARKGPLVAAGVAAALAAIGIAWYLLPVGPWLEGLRAAMRGLGLPGMALFAVIYILGAVMLAPEALLSVVAGFAYGVWGLPVVLVAATLGASAAFLIARYLARERVRRLLARRPNLAAVDRAVAEEGWKVVMLLRLSPLVPFNLQNYVFGVTAIPLSHFAAATFVGIVPGTAFYIYLGTLGSAAGAAGPIKWAFFGIGLAATILVLWLIAAKARAALGAAGIER